MEVPRLSRLTRTAVLMLATVGLLVAFATNAFAATVGIAADTIAPMTTSDVQPTYATSAMIMLTATDNLGGSGVAHTYYTIDGGSPIEGTEIVVATPGMHDLTFWSVDNAGNIENPVMTAMFTIGTAGSTDMTAPMTSSDAQPIYMGGATINLTATDEGGSGVAHTHYRLDGGPEVLGTSVQVSGLGAHTLEYWSVDNAGNAESPVMTSTFSISTCASSLSIKSSTSAPLYKRSFTLSGTLTPGAGNKVTVYYKKPGSSVWVLLSTRTAGSTGSWSYKYTPTKKGTYQFQTRFAGSSHVAARTSRTLSLTVR